MKEKTTTSPKRRCAECGGTGFSRRTREQKYKIDDTTFRITVPMDQCAKCGEGYLAGPDLQAAALRVAQRVIEAGMVSGGSFRFLRHALRLQGAGIAKLLEVTPETISRWETGKYEVDRFAWVLLAEMVLDEVAGRNTTRDRLEALHHPTELPKSVRVEP